ncbi:MAG: L-2-hydroxyglutarate oxidase [Chloroflexi bacterium]|nr:L-2-hydroxyglutarate oxidase [Chloroflexota bacterium]
MSATTHDVVVIGAGIVGLATARALLRRAPGLRLCVLEKGATVAAQQTSHNSGVIHSGIYYRPGSLKAELCVQGRAALIRYCDEHGIPYELCGKLIVATRPGELPRLEALAERATANGVQGHEMIGPERVREIEPHVVALRALWVPSTGIVDFARLAEAYADDVRAAGGEVVLGAELLDSWVRDGVRHVRAGDREHSARLFVNCAGLHADRIARRLGAPTRVQIVPFRGEYYTLRREREPLVRGLIYPVPDPDLPFLGVHFTRNIKGYTEAGPNAVLATAREGYRKRDFNLRDALEIARYPGFWRVAMREWRTGIDEVHRSLRKSVFVRDLQRLIPEVESRDLTAGGSGVRAQAVTPDGRLLDDFLIERSEAALHVLNAPSPGATSSLLIGDRIASTAAEILELTG